MSGTQVGCHVVCKVRVLLVQTCDSCKDEVVVMFFYWITEEVLFTR